LLKKMLEGEKGAGDLSIATIKGKDHSRAFSIQAADLKDIRPPHGTGKRDNSGLMKKGPAFHCVSEEEACLSP
jgi:hypothetical protein